MKYILLVTALISCSQLLQAATAAEEYLLFNSALSYKSKNAALATYPFIPDDLKDDGKDDLKDAFPDLELSSVKHKSELANEAEIVAQAKIVADKHKDLLNKAGYKNS